MKNWFVLFLIFLSSNVFSAEIGLKEKYEQISKKYIGFAKKLHVPLEYILSIKEEHHSDSNIQIIIRCKHANFIVYGVKENDVYIAKDIEGVAVASKR